MINRYPLWKYLLILVVLLVGTLYALPNLYGKDPALLVTPLRGQVMDAQAKSRVLEMVKQAGVTTKSVEQEGERLLLRFPDTESQLKATEFLAPRLDRNYSVAQNLAPATPQWLRAINAEPMYLGLDLQGGIHFLMQVNMDAAVTKDTQSAFDSIKDELRKKKLRYFGARMEGERFYFRFREEAVRDEALSRIRKLQDNLDVSTEERDGLFYVYGQLSETGVQESKKFALEQNITTLRNRVNELGVAEPVIQQQGSDRIVVQLPGVQDPELAKKILGATATLEVRLAAKQNLNADAIAQTGRVPAGTELFMSREGTPVLLERRVIFRGENIVHAASGFDSRDNTPAVHITLDDVGAEKFSDFTKDHVGDSLAVLFIESKSYTEMVDGKPTRVKKTIKEVINVAVIRERLGKRFQISGLDDPKEARTLAILLRAGALRAPIDIIEERTIGPSLGKDNVNQGFQSVLIGFVLVLIFMALYYRVFGLVANLALFFNLVIIVALLSMLQATLTLPGIAGIVLTVGMAVDANVLIFERIREEIRNGNSPQSSINAGYDKAFSTIADANITTLIAAVVLFSFGSGPIKGFAVTLSLGILTSMFTAIMGTRAVVNLIYGGRRVRKLWV